jgi:hypothetical protein
VVDVQTVNRVKKTFAKREIIHRVEHIGFSRAVIPDKTVQPGRKANFIIPDVFKIYYRNFFNLHRKLL